MEQIMSHATDFWHITLDSTWLYSGGWSLFEFDFIFKQDKYVQPVCGASKFGAGTNISQLWKTTAKSCLYTSVFIDVLKSIFFRAMCWKALTCIGQSLVSKAECCVMVCICDVQFFMISEADLHICLSAVSVSAVRWFAVFWTISLHSAALSSDLLA